MQLTSNLKKEFVYDVYYAPVTSTNEIRKILNDKSIIKGDIVSVNLTNNNQILVTFKVPVESEKPAGLKMQKQNKKGTK